MRTLTLFWLGACGAPRTAPAPAAADEPVAPPAPTLGGWHCTAYVSRATAEAEFTVEHSGASPAEADAGAWALACAQLPPTQPPGGCKVEAPPDGWEWFRVEHLSDAPPLVRVTLTLTPAPLPYRGEGDALASQAEACSAAYSSACRAAGAEAGCESAPDYVDGGTEAVERALE